MMARKGVYPGDKNGQYDREELKQADFANVRQRNANIPHVLQGEKYCGVVVADKAQGLKVLSGS